MDTGPVPAGAIASQRSGADAHFHLVLEINALHGVEAPVHEVLARPLAVGDDIEDGSAPAA